MKTFNAKRIILMAADILIIAVFGFISNLILMWHDIVASVPVSQTMQVSWSTLTLIIGMQAMMCFFALSVCGAYVFFWRLLGKHEYISCIVGFTAGMLISTGLLSFANAFDERFPLAFLFVQYVLSVSTMLLLRFYAKKAVVGLTEAGRAENYERTLIIGAGRAAHLLITDIENAKKVN